MAKASDGRALTQKVAAFASELDPAGLPLAVREKAKLHLLDAIGCGIAGADSTLSRSLLGYLRLEHSDGPVPVLGASQWFGPAAAAFANATAMNALDFDDGVEVDGMGMGHPGATIIASAVSGAFMQPTSGDQFLAAIVAAYEVNNRLIHAMQPSIERFRLVYGVCQHQTVAAGVACAKLAGIEASEMENVIGLAAIFSNVPSLRKYNFGHGEIVSFKDFNGPSAEAGVRAVQMHRCGLVGAKGVLDGPDGLWLMLGSDRFDEAVLADGLGHDWRILDSTVKPWPTCRWMHTALEAFEKLISEHQIDPGSIEKVVIHTSAGLGRDFMDAAPATMTDAQFSFPYAIASLLHRRGNAAEWYRPTAIASPTIVALAQKVTAVLDEEVHRLMSDLRRPAGRVSIETARGTLTSPLIEYALGSRERPLDAAFVKNKFLANAVPVIGEASARELFDGVEGLERIADVGELLAKGLRT